MIHQGGDFLGPLLPVLATTLGIAVLLRRAGLSTVAGYLAAGALLGPNGLGWLEESPLVTALADVGVAFLLFTIGLELSLARLRALSRLVFGLGALQVGVTITLTTGLLGAMGLSLGPALLLGAVVSMSSTAMGLKELGDRRELEAPHGRAALGILLFQDLATVVFLALVAALRVDPSGFTVRALLTEGASRLALLVGVVVVGHLVVRPALRAIAATHSAELLLLAALTVALGAAWIAHLAGVSTALGAFLAGTALAETEFRYQLDADIRPFRDVLLGLFFLTTGALIDLHGLASLALPVAGTLAAVTLGKLVTIGALAAWFGLARSSALRVGLVLAHVGEFGLLLLGVGLRDGLVPAAAGQVLLATATLGFVTGSILTRYNGPIASRLFDVLHATDHTEHGEAALGETGAMMRRHVIICGYGRVGQSVAHILDRENVSWLALDLDPGRVVDAHRGGEAVFLADASRTEILRNAGLANARGILVALDDHASAEAIVRTVRRERGFAIPVIVRVRDEEALEPLMRAGATRVLPLALEASLGLATELLIALGRPLVETTRLAEEIRREHYASLRAYYPGSTDTGPTEEDSRPLYRHSWVVPPGARIEGALLAALEFSPARLICRLREGRSIDDGIPLAAGDVLVLEGTEAELAEVADRLLGGG